MKKTLFLAIPLCVVILAGCSSTDAAVMNEKQSQTESVIAQSNEEISKTEATTFAAINEDVEPSELIPDPKDYFKDAIVNILWNDESSYSVEVTSYSLDEFEAYISKCKEMGFTQIEYEYRKIENNSGYFWANTKDNKYSLDVTTNSLNGTISITCGEKD